MNANRGFAGMALLCFAVIAVGACSKSEEVSFHYRLKTEIETPVGLRTGSSVLRVVAYGKLPGFEGLGGGSLSVRGEAVAVDLPNGKNLFVLLRSDNDVDWAAGAFPNASAAVNGRRFDEGRPTASEMVARIKEDEREYPVRRWIEYPNGTRVDDRPMLVTFKDIEDPKSVERVDPDKLEATFGAGYRLKSVTVTITNEPTAMGIEKRLAWLSRFPEPRLDPNYRGSKSPSLSQKLAHGDFRKWHN